MPKWFIILMQSILIDTSSIIFGLANKKDIFKVVRERNPAYAPIISKGVIRELESIKARREKYSKYAGAALLLIPASNVEISADPSSVDGWLAREAKSKGYAVCTNDIALKKRLKASKIRVFSITRSGSLR